MKANNHLLLVVRPLLALLGLLIVLALVVPSTWMPIGWDFQNNLWGPAHLLLAGNNPYGIKALFAETNAVWLPTGITPFLWLGALPLQWASNLWLIFNVSSLLFVIFHAARQNKPTPLRLALAAGGLVIFPATLAHLQLGQISLIATATLYSVIVFRHRITPVWAGLLLAFATVKPQLLVIFAPVYIAISVWEYGWRRTFSTLLAMAGWVIVLCAPFFALYPNWVSGLLANLAENNPWFYPTLYALVRQASGMPGLAAVAGGVWLTAGIALALYLSRRLQGTAALLWSLALTPLFSPIVWSWDFCLAYPLVLAAVMAARPHWRTWLMVGLLLSCVAGLLALRLAGVYDDQYSIWVVPITLAAVWLGSRPETTTQSE